MLESAVAQRVRLLGLDVDGVLTDNGVYLGHSGDAAVELKRFDIQDGLGLVLLHGAGIPIVLVSGRPSTATELRAAQIPIDEVVQVPGPRKLPVLERILSERGLGWEQLAFVGDDLADLPILRRAGLPIAVANAVPDVVATARVVTTARGGHGAVREVVELLLRARGQWEAAVARYLGEPDDD
ncbi:MAG TPA: HAD hydrolase family protein [Gemmatimonadales bacterium]|nr:HAD hydrolase family protein [Gemmatimonadales bacterium]